MTGINAVSSDGLQVYPLYGVALPSVAPSADPGLPAAAVNLSNEASVIATLGSVGSTDLPLYDATGLLNSLSQAGVQTGSSLTIPPPGTDVPNLTQQIQNQAISSILAAATAQSVPDLYAADGSATGLAPNLTTVYAGLLKSDPNLASTVISDAFNQGIVGSLNVSA